MDPKFSGLVMRAAMTDAVLFGHDRPASTAERPTERPQGTALRTSRTLLSSTNLTVDLKRKNPHAVADAESMDAKEAKDAFARATKRLLRGTPRPALVAGLAPAPASAPPLRACADSAAAARAAPTSEPAAARKPMAGTAARKPAKPMSDVWKSLEYILGDVEVGGPSSAGADIAPAAKAARPDIVVSPTTARGGKGKHAAAAPAAAARVPPSSPSAGVAGVRAFVALDSGWDEIASMEAERLEHEADARERRSAPR